MVLARSTMASRLWSHTTMRTRPRPAACSAGPRWSRTKSRSSSALYRHESQRCWASGSFCTVTPQIGTPFGFIGLDEAHEALRPGRPALRAAGGHRRSSAGGLHPRRRAPGRGQQLQRPAAPHACAAWIIGSRCPPVAFDAEVLQREVAGLFGMRVVAQREVAAVHVHAAQRVAVALLRVEAGAQEGILLRCRTACCQVAAAPR